MSWEKSSRERSLVFEIVQTEIPNTKTKLQGGLGLRSDLGSSSATIQTPWTCALHLDLQMQQTEGVI